MLMPASQPGEAGVARGGVDTKPRSSMDEFVDELAVLHRAQRARRRLMRRGPVSHVVVVAVGVLILVRCSSSTHPASGSVTTTTDHVGSPTTTDPDEATDASAAGATPPPDGGHRVGVRRGWVPCG